MYENEIKDVIRINTDEKEAEIPEREKRVKAVGSNIARFFEQSNYSLAKVLSVEYKATVFTHNKTMAPLEFASEILLSKGYVIMVGIRRKEGDNFWALPVFIAGKVEETDDFKKSIERAVKEEKSEFRKSIQKAIKKV